MTDSVAKLKSLLRGRWGTMTAIPNVGNSGPVKANRGVASRSELKPRSAASSCRGAEIASGAGGGSSRPGGSAGAKPSSEPAASDRERDCAWVAGSGRWKFDVNYRHSIYEGNTLLNFAVRCGRRKTAEFIMRQMRGNTEAGDDGGFTPLLNAAWRGDAALVRQLYEAGARLDVTGTSRGEGPYSPIEWAERKVRPNTVAVLRKLLAAEARATETRDGNRMSAKSPI